MIYAQAEHVNKLKKRFSGNSELQKFGTTPGSLWFGLILYVPVNSYGHVGMVSSPYYTFFPGQS